MDAQWVADKIVEYEWDAGESFAESGYRINELQFMSWCYGRGYLTPEQYNEWSKLWQSSEVEACDMSCYLHNDDGADGFSFALVHSDGYDIEVAKQAYLIVGEFIVSVDIHCDRFMKFLEKHNIQ